MVAAATRRARTVVVAFLLANASGAGAQWLTPFRPINLQYASELRRYMCSQEFGALVHSGRDLAAVDSLFARAMAICDNDPCSALLAAAFACFDHRTIHFKAGFFTIPIPLTFEGDSVTACVRANLPSHLFVDTPHEGDRDKLQHFFGSAYLEWMLKFKPVTTMIGGGLELFEPALIVGGVDDDRDLRADKAGQAFALLFDEQSYVAPSEILKRVR